MKKRVSKLSQREENKIKWNQFTLFFSFQKVEENDMTQSAHHITHSFTQREKRKKSDLLAMRQASKASKKKSTSREKKKSLTR